MRVSPICKNDDAQKSLQTMVILIGHIGSHSVVFHRRLRLADLGQSNMTTAERIVLVPRLHSPCKSHEIALYIASSRFFQDASFGEQIYHDILKVFC